MATIPLLYLQMNKSSPATLVSVLSETNVHVALSMLLSCIYVSEFVCLFPRVRVSVLPTPSKSSGKADRFPRSTLGTNRTSCERCKDETGPSRNSAQISHLASPNSVTLEDIPLVSSFSFSVILFSLSFISIIIDPFIIDLYWVYLHFACCNDVDVFSLLSSDPVFFFTFCFDVQRLLYLLEYLNSDITSPTEEDPSHSTRRRLWRGISGTLCEVLDQVSFNGCTFQLPVATCYFSPKCEQ